MRSKAVILKEEELKRREAFAPTAKEVTSLVADLMKKEVKTARREWEASLQEALGKALSSGARDKDLGHVKGGMEGVGSSTELKKVVDELRDDVAFCVEEVGTKVEALRELVVFNLSGGSFVLFCFVLVWVLVIILVLVVWVSDPPQSSFVHRAHPRRSVANFVSARSAVVSFCLKLTVSYTA